MTVASTSRQAYDKIMGTLSDKQEQVYEALKELTTATNDEIADFLGWPINRVTGRVTELRNKDLVTVAGLGKSKAGFSAKVWTWKTADDKKVKDYSNDCY